MKSQNLLILLLTIFMTFGVSKAQVSINSSGAAPDASAMLDISGDGYGVLVPRMTQANRPGSPATGLLIYQTDNNPGFYYYDGSNWQRLSKGDEAWSLSGNSGTSAGTDFLGTTDNQDLVIKTNNSEKIRIETDGNVGIGTNNPSRKLHIYGTSNNAADVYSQTDAGRIVKHWFVNGGRSWSVGQTGTTSTPAYSFRITDETASAIRMTIEGNTGNVGINTSDPESSAQLDIESTDKGILIPRVTLDDATTAAPVSSPAEGLLIYNDGGSENEGFYYWNGTQWKNMYSGDVPSVPGDTEYWLRPDSDPTYIYPEGNEYIRIYDQGETYGIWYEGSTNQYGIWSQTGNSTDPTAAVVGFSNVSGNQTYGYLGYNGTYSSGTGFGSVDGMAVYGVVDDPSRAAGFFRTTSNASMASLISYSDVWIGGYFYTDNADNTYAARPALYAQAMVDCDQSGYQNAIKGYSEFTHTTNNGYTVGGSFIGKGGTQDAIGVQGAAYTAASNNTTSSGGYFQAQNSYYSTSAYAYVADEYNGRKITGSGSVSEIIPTKKHGRITMTCPEAPEYWYFDYGTVEMKNGKAHVDLDPIFADIIVVNNKHPLKVFLQVNILNSNGVAVINKSKTGFDLVEKNGGKSSGEIDYKIVAKPKSLYGEGRFVQARGPAWLKPNEEPEQAKAKNQRDKKNIYTWPADWEVYNYNPEDCVNIGDIIPAGTNAGKIKGPNGTYLDKKSKKK